MTEPITAIVLGAGDRGHKYGLYALAYPDELNIVAVADPRPAYRDDFADAHQIAPEYRYESWEALLDQPRMATAAIITLPDRLHYHAAIIAMRKGYEVLLEKPMSPVLTENIRLIEVSEEEKRLLTVCHVLRYTTFFQQVRHIVQAGRLGRIVHIDHKENVAYWHMAHSFVRGNWRNSIQAGPMILTKCCHDFDILYWLLRDKVMQVSSFGALTHYTAANRPPDAPDRCTDGCPVAETCKWDAVRFYANDKTGWPYDVVSLEATPSARLEALKTGPYGRCVYACDNDVVDHQVVLMETEKGTTITLTMQGHAEEEHRSLRIEGTQGTLVGKFSRYGHELAVHDHLTGTVENIAIEDAYQQGAHSGGDFGLMKAFINVLLGIPDDSLTTARESLESHLLAFAAEQARLSGQVVTLDSLRLSGDTTIR